MTRLISLFNFESSFFTDTGKSFGKVLNSLFLSSSNIEKLKSSFKIILNFFFILPSSTYTILIPFESKSKSGIILSAKTSRGSPASFVIKFKIALQVNLTVLCLNFFEAS